MIGTGDGAIGEEAGLDGSAGLVGRVGACDVGWDGFTIGDEGGVGAAGGCGTNGGGFRIGGEE